jgi:hypothetical protein
MYEVVENNRGTTFKVQGSRFKAQNNPRGETSPRARAHRQRPLPRQKPIAKNPSTPSLHSAHQSFVLVFRVPTGTRMPSKLKHKSRYHENETWTYDILLSFATWSYIFFVCSRIQQFSSLLPTEKMCCERQTLPHSAVINFR